MPCSMAGQQVLEAMVSGGVGHPEVPTCPCFIYWIDVTAGHDEAGSRCRRVRFVGDAGEVVLEISLEIEVYGFAQNITASVLEVTSNEASPFQHPPRQGAFEGLSVMFQDDRGYVGENAGGQCGRGDGVGNGHV